MEARRLNRNGVPLVGSFAPPAVKKSLKTVKAAIFREGQGGPEILLVREKAGVGGPTHPYFSDEGKPAGWGLPGGGVEYGEESRARIFREIKARGFDFGGAMAFDPTGEERLAVVREVLEETGFGVGAGRLLLREHLPTDHTVEVFQAIILGGELVRTSEETDDAGWFPVSALPPNMYRMDRERIEKMVRFLFGANSHEEA